MLLSREWEITVSPLHSETTCSVTSRCMAPLLPSHTAFASCAMLRGTPALPLPRHSHFVLAKPAGKRGETLHNTLAAHRAVGTDLVPLWGPAVWSKNVPIHLGSCSHVGVPEFTLQDFQWWHWKPSIKEQGHTWTQFILSYFSRSTSIVAIQCLQACKDQGQDQTGVGRRVLITNRISWPLCQKAKTWRHFGVCTSKDPGLHRGIEKGRYMKSVTAVQGRYWDHLAEHQTTATLSTQQGPTLTGHLPASLDAKQVTAQLARSIALLPFPVLSPGWYAQGAPLLICITCRHQLPSFWLLTLWKRGNWVPHNCIRRHTRFFWCIPPPALFLCHTALCCSGHAHPALFYF